MEWNESAGILILILGSMALSLSAIAVFSWLSYREGRRTKELERQLNHEISLRGKMYTLEE